MDIRIATHADAHDGSMVLRRSIAELCHADHDDDQTIVADWIANKTPEAWNAWLGQEGTELYVAVEDGQIAGVGMLDHVGTIMLNYVSPDHRWQGVSKALLAHMECEASSWGLRKCVLESTKTACAFYERVGYRSSDGGMSMTKVIAI